MPGLAGSPHVQPVTAITVQDPSVGEGKPAPPEREDPAEGSPRPLAQPGCICLLGRQCGHSRETRRPQSAPRALSHPPPRHPTYLDRKPHTHWQGRWTCPVHRQTDTPTDTPTQAPAQAIPAGSPRQDSDLPEHLRTAGPSNCASVLGWALPTGTHILVFSLSP